MFEKEIRFIHDICMNQINRLGSFVTFEELTGTELHPAILKYISAEIDLMILEDRQKLLEQSNFDYTGEEMTDAFRQVGQIIKNSKKFPIDYVSNLILLAISFNMNYLIRPRHTLVDFIYQNENVLNANFVKYMLNYTYYYSYIRKVFEKYSMKKALLTVPKSDFENILSRLDQEMFDSHTNRIMDTALNSIADFFNIGSLNKTKIPLSAVEPFLLEKNLDNYLDRLHTAFPTVTKFTYSIPDVQRVMYSTAPIKRESYLDKNANKKIQDSLLGLEEKVVTPKEDAKWNNTEKPAEEVSKVEFQEAEFTLIPESEEKENTISRLRSKSITTEKKESEPAKEEIKVKEPLKQEPENKVSPVENETEKPVVENTAQSKKTEETKVKTPVVTDDKVLSKKDETVDMGLLEAEEADLLNLYDREVERKDIEPSAPEENNTGEKYPQVEETFVNSDDDNSSDNIGNEEEIPADNFQEQENIPVEPSIEEEIDSDEDEFIVVGEEVSVPVEKPNSIKPPVDYKNFEPIAVPEIKSENLQPEIKPELKKVEERPVQQVKPKLDNIRKRRILVKKVKPSNGKEHNTDTEPLADESKDEVDQIKITNENITEIPENSTVTNIDIEVQSIEEEPVEIEEQIDTRGDIFSCFTEKELQRILKGVFNDDAEDFALTLDTMSACNNYDEAVKLLRSLFRSYKVKHKSKEAIILKRAVSEYYRRSNDIDLI